MPFLFLFSTTNVLVRTQWAYAHEGFSAKLQWCTKPWRCVGRQHSRRKLCLLLIRSGVCRGPRARDRSIELVTVIVSRRQMLLLLLLSWYLVLESASFCLRLPELLVEPGRRPPENPAQRRGRRGGAANLDWLA